MACLGSSQPSCRVGGAKLRYNIVNSAVIEKSPVSKKSVIICQPDIK